MTLKDKRLASAIQYNKNRAKRIGWLEYFDGILIMLNIASSDVSSSKFAISVSNWQKTHNLFSDGKIGPKTWSKMQEEGGRVVIKNLKNLVPSWLTTESLLCSIDSRREFNKINDFSWSIYKFDVVLKELEIDIKPFRIPDQKLLNLIFKGGISPDGITISWSENQGCSVRALIMIDQKIKILNLASLCTYKFKYLFFYQQFGLAVGWEARAKDRMEAHNKALMEKRTFLGGRSYFDIMELGLGAYEIPNIGFVWFGTVGRGLVIESQPSISVDKEIRWYLERGTSLTKAVSLIIRQGKNLNAQMAGAIVLSIVGSAKSAGAVLKLKETSLLSKGATTTVSSFKKEGIINTNLNSSFAAHFAGSEVESIIQSLKNNRIEKIKKLNIIR